ncbi:MAG: ligase-associated DNA damage response endonuclease PdeM [Thalassobaculales bacterium]
MRTQPILLNGALLEAEASGALWWPAEGALLVADLHLEKGSAFAARGRLLPPYDTRETLARLAEAVERRRPARVICLGDSFHDRDAAARIAAADIAAIEALTARADWVWIAGNHDPVPPAGWGGRVARDLVIGPLALRHEAAAGPVGGEVSGHYHPKARVPVASRARSVTGRCFVEDGRRLVLPAFGAYAGGLDVLDPAIGRLFPRGFRVHVIGRTTIRTLPATALAG